MVEDLVSQTNARAEIFFVQPLEPVPAPEGGVPWGVGPEPTQPPATLAPPDGCNPEGGDPLTFALVPCGEMAVVAAGNQGGQPAENHQPLGEICFGSPEVLRIAETPFFGSYAHAEPPGRGGDGCEHGTQRLIQQVSAEFQVESSGQTFPLDKVVEQVPCALQFSGNVFFPENSPSSQATQMLSGNQMVAEGGECLPLAQVLEFVQQGVPAEIFFLPNGQRFSPVEEKVNLAQWERNQFCLGGGEEDPSTAPPRERVPRPRDVEGSHSASSSPDKKRLREGDIELDISQGIEPSPPNLENPEPRALEDSESWGGGGSDQSDPWLEWGAQISTQVKEVLSRIEGLEGRGDTHPFQKHMLESLEVARRQSNDFLESESIRITNGLEKRAEELRQQFLNEINQHVSELLARQRVQLNELYLDKNSELIARVDGLQVSIQKILEMCSSQELSRNQLQVAVGNVSKAVERQVDASNQNMQLVNRNFQIMSQQVQHFSQQVAQKFQGYDELFLKFHRDLETRMLQSASSTARDLQNLGSALQGLQLNLDSCKSQDSVLQGQVLQVQQGVQSALGQVASKVQQSDSHTRALENKISEMQGAIFSKSQVAVAAPIPAPVIVPVTIHMEKGTGSGTIIDKPVAEGPAPAIGFTLEPLEDGLASILEGTSISPALGFGFDGPKRSVRQVTSSVSGGRQDPNSSSMPFSGDLVAQRIARNLEQPNFDEKHPNWLDFEAAWITYWDQLSQGKGYSEAQKLQVFVQSLSPSLKQQVNLLSKGQKLGFTTVFAWLKAHYGSFPSLAARKIWHEIFLQTSNRMKPFEWREFWTRFSLARVNVKDSTEEEAYRLLLSRIPHFIIKWVIEEQRNRSSKKCQVRLQAIANLTSIELVGAIEGLIRVTPRETKSIGNGEYLIDFDSLESAQKLLMLSGRTIVGHQKPLTAELVEYRMTPEEIDSFVYNKLCTLEEVNEAVGMFKDFSPALPPKNSKFSARVCSLDEGGVDEAPAEICQVNQLASSTAATTKSNPARGQFPLLKAVAPTPQTQGPSQPQFLCYGCGEPGHIKRNCPFSNPDGAQLDQHVPGKGKGGKGVPPQGFSKGAGGKGKGRGDGKGGAAGPGNSGRGAGKGSQPPVFAPQPAVSHASVQCEKSE